MSLKEKSIKIGAKIVSHDLAVIRAVAVMKDAHIIEQGAAQEIVERPREAYTRALIEAAFQTENK